VKWCVGRDGRKRAVSCLQETALTRETPDPGETPSPRSSSGHMSHTTLSPTQRQEELRGYARVEDIRRLSPGWCSCRLLWAGLSRAQVPGEDPKGSYIPFPPTRHRCGPPVKAREGMHPPDSPNAPAAGAPRKQERL
jgi:hypothetical protein